jgi:hypothetical protein
MMATALLGPPPPFYDGKHWIEPAWCKHGAVFALHGKTWRVVSMGNHNNTPGRTDGRPCSCAGATQETNWHHAPECPGYKWMCPWVACEQLSERFAFPDLPCPKADVAEALARINHMQHFNADELHQAIHVVPAPMDP